VGDAIEKLDAFFTISKGVDVIAIEFLLPIVYCADIVNLKRLEKC